MGESAQSFTQRLTEQVSRALRQRQQAGRSRGGDEGVVTGATGTESRACTRGQWAVELDRGLRLTPCRALNARLVSVFFTQ